MASDLLKCDDCQKHDGLFQCCHCHQRLCIRCCNKHHKKVTIELEQLHTLTERLMSKVIHIKNDLERQKNEALEQCHKWRLDTINTINRAHQLTIQTIHHEYELLNKDYEDFVDKEMAHINIDKNHLSRMKRDNFGSLISSLSVTPVETDSNNSLDSIRQRIEAFAKQIDETGKFSFQAILPSIELHDTPKIESRFGDITRCACISWENEEMPDRETEAEGEQSQQQHQPIPSTQKAVSNGQQVDQPSAEGDKATFSPNHRTEDSSSFPPTNNHASSPRRSPPVQPESHVANHFNSNRRHTYTFHRTLSIPPSFIQQDYHEQKDPYVRSSSSSPAKAVRDDIFDDSQKYDGIIARRRLRLDVCSPRRRTTTALSSRASSVQNDRLLRQSWFYNPTVTTASFIQ